MTRRTLFKLAPAVPFLGVATVHGSAPNPEANRTLQSGGYWWESLNPNDMTVVETSGKIHGPPRRAKIDMKDSAHVYIKFATTEEANRFNDFIRSGWPGSPF